MKFKRTVWGRERGRWARDQLTPSQAVVYDRMRDLFEVGEYEKAEAGARALAATPRHFWDRGPALEWLTGALATAAAIAHGRGAEVLAELDALITDLERTTGAGRALLLEVRVNRMAALVDQGRYTEAEAEADGILRAAVRIAHFAKVWGIELSALANLAAALCGQARYEEAEAIARGNLSRAQAGTAAALHCVLVRSLNGQGRHEEALTEARRFTPLWVRTESGALDIGTATALHGLGLWGAITLVPASTWDFEARLRSWHARAPWRSAWSISPLSASSGCSSCSPVPNEPRTSNCWRCATK